MNDESIPSQEQPISVPQELAPAVIPAESPVVIKEDGNVAVTALIPADMQTCQSALIVWVEHKIATIEAEAAELQGAYEHAKAKKWKSDVFKRHSALAGKRVEFYRKMKLALKNGFVIVPNFPIQMFLIRTDREAPLRMVTDTTWLADLKQKAQLLPAGEAGYENPFPLIRKYRVAKPEPNRPDATTVRHEAVEWDEIDFPVSMAKPQIMEAVTRAMALNVFDQIGILPNSRKEDPLIIGQLIDPREKWGNKVVSFMIAWHLDTRTI